MSKVKVSDIRSALVEHSDAEKAMQMKSYMKDLFPFYGIQAPKRKEIFRQLKAMDSWSLQDYRSLIRDCFQEKEREMHYMGLEIMDASKKFWKDDEYVFIEELIQINSWWDTVDWLASITGKFFQRYPENLKEITEQWNLHENMWLNRVSIIFQLHYKEDTNWELLQRYILRHKESKEFFIQKAQGWALRQYAKKYPNKVRDFIHKNPALSTLTKREAMKHL